MPLIRFVDDELITELNKVNRNDNNQNEALEEHQFIANCLQIGLRIDDLKQMEYKDVAKIMLCFVGKKKQSRKATQSDWDRLAGRG